MARPTKQGVDYFPLDVHLDDKFKFIEIKYKLEGFAVLVKLLQKIYSCGYWYKWTEDEALLFSDEIRADFTLVINVVNECLMRDVFCKELHERYKILTSKGIQKRYKEMVRRRKDVEVMEEFLLIDSIYGVNVVNNSINDDTMPEEGQHDDGKSTQSKVNKTKVNKTKEKKKSKKTPCHKFETCDLEAAQLLFALMRENNPNAKKPNFEKWANEVRLMREMDKRTIEQIVYLIKWTQADVFWRSNVLSVAKLRKQFDVLVLRVKEKHATQPKKSLFAQGEESKRRQEEAEANLKPLTPEEEKALEELPY